MFKVLAQEGINIQIITTSEIKISVVIEEKYLELAVRALHSAFELGDPGGEHSSKWSAWRAYPAHRLIYGLAICRDKQILEEVW